MVGFVKELKFIRITLLTKKYTYEKLHLYFLSIYFMRMRK